MKRFFIYFAAQLKRTAALLPFVLTVSFLLFAGVFAYAAASANERAEDPARIRMKIGLSGNFENKYMALAVSALENYDYTRVSLSFAKGTEEELRAKMEEGDISACIVFPEDFFEAIGHGEHHEIRYITPRGQTGVSEALMRDVVSGVSRVLLACENSIYGIQAFVAERAPDKDVIEESNVLIKTYFAQIVRRDGMFTSKDVGVGNGQTYEKYMFAGLSVFFMMIWGVCFAPLKTGGRATLYKMLAASGFGCGRQLAAEWLTHEIVTVLGLTVSWLSAAGCAALLFPDVLPAILPENALTFVFSALAAALLFGTVSFAFYEIADNTVGALLLLTLFSLLCGFLSGCFYPSSFFSPAVRTIGSILPSGIAVRFLCAPTPTDLLLLFLYTALFALLSYIFRRKRTEERGARR